MFIVIIIFVTLLAVCISSPFRGVVILTICYSTLSCFSLYGFSIVVLLSIILLIKWILMRNSDMICHAKFPFVFVFIICATSYILSSLLNSERQHIGLYALAKQILPYVLCFLLWRFYKPCKKNNAFYFGVFISYFFVCCIIGMLDVIAEESVFTDFRQSLGDEIEEFGDNSDRTGFFHAYSLMVWPEVYGINLSFAMFFLLSLLAFGKIHLNSFLMVLLLLMLMGIVTTNSRTCLVTMLIMISGLFSKFYLNKKVLFTILFSFSLLLYVNYDVCLNILNSIIHPDEVGGSSIEGRIKQLEVTILLASQNLLFGQGSYAVKYYTDLYHDSLLGAESIVFTVLLTRGLFGLFSVILLWGKSIFYLFSLNYYFLTSMVLGFIFAKIATLIWGVDETFFLFYMIPMIRFFQTKT